MEANPNIKLGTIVQINPSFCPEHGGQFCIVTEILNFGIQGYLALTLPIEGLVRYKGLAYRRLKWEAIEVVGSVEWELTHTEATDQNDNQYDRSK